MNCVHAWVHKDAKRIHLMVFVQLFHGIVNSNSDCGVYEPLKILNLGIS